MIKAMSFHFIVLLIVAQTRVYTNTDNFLSNFLSLFIYCKRAGWKYSPLMAKWERGSKVREEGQQVVWWRLHKHKEEWDRTGAQNEQVAHQTPRGELTKREALPGTHRTWIDDRHYPR